nr:hypothetical protein [uncultured Flavobacterium sp.]
MERINYRQHLLQRIRAIGSIESWSCIWDELSNPLYYEKAIIYVVGT